MPRIIDVDQAGTAKERPEQSERQPRAAPKVKDADKPRQRSPQDRKLQTSVAEMYQGVGTLVVGIGIPRQDQGLVGTGTALIEQSEGLADAWMTLADKNPKVKDALKRMTEASATGTLVAMHVACVMPLLASRGVLPGPLGAVVLADTEGSNGDAPDLFGMGTPNGHPAQDIFGGPA